MLGVTLNNNHRKLVNGTKKERREILLPADSIDKCRMLTSRSQWCAETSATLSLKLPHGVMRDKYRFDPNRTRKRVPIEVDVYERFVREIPEAERQVFLDSLFDYEARQAVGTMLSRYSWHMAYPDGVYGRKRMIAERTRKKLEEVLGKNEVDRLLAGKK